MQSRHSPQSSVERRRRLELEVGDERTEHDPGAVAARDQQRVLAVEADAASCCRLAVDVLVRVDEHAVARRSRRTAVRARRASRAAPRTRRTTCSAAAARGPRAAPARARSSRAPRRRPCARRAAASPDGTSAPGCAIVNFMSAKRPRARPLANVALGARRTATAGVAPTASSPSSSASCSSSARRTRIVCRRCRRCGSTRTAAPRCSCSRRWPIPSRGPARC